MRWFERHLNWVIVVATIVSSVLIMATCASLDVRDVREIWAWAAFATILTNMSFLPTKTLAAAISHIGIPQNGYWHGSWWIIWWAWFGALVAFLRLRKRSLFWSALLFLVPWGWIALLFLKSKKAEEMMPETPEKQADEPTGQPVADFTPPRKDGQ